MNKVLKNSEDWLKEYPGLIIMDPDGWDRSPEGWEKSWNELITEAEFNKRAAMSTCGFSAEYRKKHFKL